MPDTKQRCDFAGCGDDYAGLIWNPRGPIGSFSYDTCPICEGTGIRPDDFDARVAALNAALEVDDA